MSAFNVKPSNGWIHSDKLISKQGATYAVRYVGCLEVKVSMKQLDFKTRSNVAKECINRVCETLRIKTVDRKRKIDKKVLKSIADTPNLQHAGTNVNLNISSISLTLTSLENNQVIACHEMPKISFASGGDSDTLDFVGYIAKDVNDMRACYVLECGGGLAKDVIATIGQAFELRFQQFTNKSSMICDLGTSLGNIPPVTGGDVDKDYYNDLPGKVPPDVEPPPVPPLPTVVLPFTTLPPVQAPNLIDLSSEVSHDAPQHEYVNDIVARERDVFDMKPFSQPSSGAFSKDPIGNIEDEVWFHGQISRAEAENLLQKDGDFLVRESTNTIERQFVLSGIQDGNKKHLLLIDPEGVVRTKDRVFSSISHLIEYHYENALPIISAESALVLRNKVPRTS